MRQFVLILLSLTATLAYSQTAIQPNGSGTAASPYEISSIENLLWVSQNSTSWNSYFVQTQNIDASATSTWPGNFPPIGSLSPYFKGNYNGNGYVIDSLVISTSQYAGALFGRVTASGASISVGIHDLGISNASVTNSNFTPMLTGGIVAYLIGGASIEHCWFTGTINSVAGFAAGGIVGAVDGNSLVSQCWTSGEINASNYPLVAAAPFVGGIAGEFRGIMNDCYSTANINSGTTAGGLCGSVYNVFGPGVVERCYASGTVPTGAKALVGTTGTAAPTFSNLYFNSDQYQGVVSGVISGATSLSNAQMQQSSSFTGFNFSGIWSMIPGKNNSWPVLDSALAPCSTPINGLLSATQLEFCVPDFAQITADSGYSYLWNTGDTTQSITVYNSGPYYVVLTTTDGCTATSDTVSITAKPAVATPSISHSNTTWVPEGSVAIYTVPYDSSYTYVWGASGGTIAVGQYTNGVAVQWGMPDSNARVWVVVSNGICSNSDTINLRVSGLGTLENQKDALVYPNPSTGAFTLNVPHQFVQGQFEITSIYGHVITSGRIESTLTAIDISGVGNGLFHLVIRNGEHRIVAPLLVQ